MGNSTINDYDWCIFQHAMFDENSVDWTAHLRPPLLQGFGIWWRVSGVSAELSTNGSVWNSPPNHFHIKKDYFDLFWSILICIYIYSQFSDTHVHHVDHLPLISSKPRHMDLNFRHLKRFIPLDVLAECHETGHSQNLASENTCKKWCNHMAVCQNQ